MKSKNRAKDEGNVEQFNGREGETATFFSRCLFPLKLRGGGFAPRHLKRSMPSGAANDSAKSRQCFIFMELNMKILFLLIICLSLFFSPFIGFYPAVSNAQTSLPQKSDETEKDEFKRLVNELTVLRKEFATPFDSDSRLRQLNAKEQIEFKQLINRSTENAIALNALKELSSKRIPQAYSEDIADDADLVEQVRLSKDVKRRELEKVRFVNTDVQIKRGQAEARTEAPFDLITIVVKTWKNDVEVNRFKVWFVNMRNKDNEAKYQSFDKFSSPTSKDLPPGNYLMWTTGNGRVGERQPKTFGDGKATIETDLVAN